jgi:aspartate/methionine/tyrosine aminotransferase
VQNYASRILAAASAEFAGYQGSPTAGSYAEDLSTGEIRITYPDWLTDVLASGVQSAPLGYVDPQGLVGLRKQYASFVNTQGYAVDERHVLVTSGAKEAVFVALLANCEEGTPFLLPRPGWTPYLMWAQALGAPVHFYDPRGGDLVGRLEVLFRQAPSAVLILNSPHNPTGVEITGEDLSSILERAKRYQITVLSDEVYRSFAHGKPAASVLSRIQEGERQVVCVDSLSKMLGLAGLRIGFLLADPRTVKELEVVRSSFGSCVSSVSQSIAQALLSHDHCREWLEQIVRVSARTLSSVEVCLRRHGYHVESAGAVYLWVEEQALASGQSTTHIQVGGTPMKVTPGSLFGCPGFFRLCPLRERAVLASVFPDMRMDE